MPEFFVISVVFLIVGIGCLGVAVYLYRRWTPERLRKAKKIYPSFVKNRPQNVDLSSPDKALQSYWEYLDYVKSVEKEPKINEHIKCQIAFDEYLKEITPVEQPFLETFFSGEALQARLKNMRNPASEDPREKIQIKYERKLREIKFPTDTRAEVVCTVYNITPVDKLKQPLTKEEQDGREHGIEFIYSMEKFGKGWKIIGRKALCPHCFGAGRSEGEICPRCNAAGWLVLDVDEHIESEEENYWYYGIQPDDN